MRETGRFRLDNPQALNTFLAGIERRAFRMCEIATGSREDALDLVQDAMMKLVDKYANREPEDWPPLFHRILQSRIRDWYRREKVKRSVIGFFGVRSDATGQDPAIESFPGRAANEPENWLETDRLIEQLKPALHALPLRQQQVFLLRLWEGLDVRQTALAMSCSEGSVKTHYSRALHTLREKLASYAVE